MLDIVLFYYWLNLGRPTPIKKRLENAVKIIEMVLVQYWLKYGITIWNIDRKKPGKMSEMILGWYWIKS